MKYKSVYTRLVALLLIATLALAGCSAETSWPSQEVTESLQKISDTFSQVYQCLQEGTLRLKIYYLDLGILTRIPLTVDMLIDASFAEVITVESDDLQKCSELLNQLQEAALVPIENVSKQNVRLCYVFETPDNGAMLTIGFTSQGFTDYTVLVNGLEVEYDDIFYNLIRPFITEDMRDTFDTEFEDKAPIFAPTPR